MPKLKVYFAHPYSTRGGKGEAEILDILTDRPLEVINPFDSEDNIMLKKYGRTKYYPDPPYKLGRDIWMQDLRQVAKADMLVAWAPDRGSMGTGVEIFHAYQLHKFIQIISAIKHPLFAWVLTGGNQQFVDIADFRRLKPLRWIDNSKREW